MVHIKGPEVCRRLIRTQITGSHHQSFYLVELGWGPMATHWITWRLKYTDGWALFPKILILTDLGYDLGIV